MTPRVQAWMSGRMMLPTVVKKGGSRVGFGQGMKEIKSCFSQIMFELMTKPMPTKQNKVN